MQKIYIVMSSWDTFSPSDDYIEACFSSIDGAKKYIDTAPKTSQETGFEPKLYEIKEFVVNE